MWRVAPLLVLLAAGCDSDSAAKPYFLLVEVTPPEGDTLTLAPDPKLFVQFRQPGLGGQNDVVIFVEQSMLTLPADFTLEFSEPPVDAPSEVRIDGASDDNCLLACGIGEIALPQQTELGDDYYEEGGATIKEINVSLATDCTATLTGRARICP